MQSNISFILFSYNEEKRIEYIVRNLVPYGEVYLLDGGSTDRTGEIAEKFGAKFYLRPDRTSVSVETQANLDFVRGLVKTDWIFWSYVDNFLPKTLLEKMVEISNQDKYKSVFVPIFTYMWGEIRQPVIKASYSNFFRKEMVDMSHNHIHGSGDFLGTKNEVLHLPMKQEYAICHFSLYDLNKYITGHLRYANAEAEEKYQFGRRFSIFYMLGSMLRYFYLFYKTGFKAGARGLYGALLYTCFRLMVSVRLYELEHNLTLESIEHEFVKKKKQMVEDVERAVK